jgi:hypothetical protein
VVVNVRILLVSVGLLVICGVTSSQPTPVPSKAPPAPPLNLTPKTLPTQSDLIPAPLSVPTAPAEKSVDELLTELERVQAQKASLEKKEQELKTLLQKKLEQQSERLKKLGVAPQPAKGAEPDRVGQIILEGNAKKDEKKILDALGLHPGQVLQYPKLEGARARLQKAGFRDVAIEVAPNELDITFKDIVVRIGQDKR